MLLANNVFLFPWRRQTKVTKEKHWGLKIIGFSQPLGYLWAPPVSEVVRFQISGISFWSTEALMIIPLISNIYRYSLTSLSCWFFSCLLRNYTCCKEKMQSIGNWQLAIGIVGGGRKIKEMDGMGCRLGMVHNHASFWT